MTWTGRRQEKWIPRKPRAPRATVKGPAIGQPTASPPVHPASVMVPDFPCFSPAAVAQVVGKHRATVQYWLDNSKLEFFRDNIGARYVLRAELIRFIQEYLKQEVGDHG